MKRTERHHLKENTVATWVSRSKETFEEKQRPIVGVVIGVVVVAAAIGGYSAWRAMSNGRAETMLGEAMRISQAQVVPPQAPGTAATPAEAPAPPPSGSYPSERAKLEAALPKFIATADAHPSAPAGVAARYHAGSALAALGRFAEAEKYYREAAERGKDSLYGQMAKVGLAALQVRAGKYADASTLTNEIIASGKDELPVDAVLMELGRAYAASGKNAEALQTFRRLVTEFPESIYTSDAKREIESLSPNPTPGA